MSEFYLNKYKYHTSGKVYAIDEQSPDFTLTESDLKLWHLNDYIGQAILFNVFPSIDTPVCVSSCTQINQLANNKLNIFGVSKDLPFALKRCESEKKFKNIKLLSDFRNNNFGNAFGLTIIDGPYAGLLAREVIVLDKDHSIAYQDFVEDIIDSPNIALAMEAINDLSN